MFNNSGPADDPPEPQRLEPVGVEGREVDGRVGPDRDADEGPAPPLVIRARRMRLLVLERLVDGGLGERVLLVDGDEGVLRARVRAREAPLVLRLLRRKVIKARGVEAQDGPRRRAGRPRGPVRVFFTFRTLRMGSS